MKRRWRCTCVGTGLHAYQLWRDSLALPHQQRSFGRVPGFPCGSAGRSDTRLDQAVCPMGRADSFTRTAGPMQVDPSHAISGESVAGNGFRFQRKTTMERPPITASALGTLLMTPNTRTKYTPGGTLATPVTACVARRSDEQKA